METLRLGTIFWLQYSTHTGGVTRWKSSCPDRLAEATDVGIKSQALTLLFFSCTAADLRFTKNPAIDVGADCLAAPRRNVEADSAAQWQRAEPLDHLQVAAVRAAWHES